MTWVKLDDHIATHPKLLAAGAEPAWLFVAGLGWCNQHLTDGMIPKDTVPVLSNVKSPARCAARLVEAGLWIDRGKEYEVHDFLDYQPSKAQVLSQRDAQRERQRKSRERRGVTDGVSADTPTRPDPTRLLESDPDDHDVGLGERSSWSDDEAYIEAGRISARCFSGTFTRGFDHYATGASRRIRSERAWMLPQLRERGYTLTQAASVLAHPDSPRLVGTDWARIEAGFDDDWTPADEIPISEHFDDERIEANR